MEKDKNGTYLIQQVLHSVRKSQIPTPFRYLMLLCVLFHEISLIFGL